MHMVGGSQKLGASHPETLNSMQNLATTYNLVGNTEKALPLMQQAMKLGSAIYAPDDLFMIRIQGNLAGIYQANGELQKAIELLETALESSTTKLGDEHPETLRLMNNVASAYQKTGRLDQALVLTKRTFELRKKTLGHGNRVTLITMHNLATLYEAMENHEEAAGLYAEVWELKKQEIGHEHPSTLNSMNGLALVNIKLGQVDKTETLLTQLFDIRKKRQGINNPQTLSVLKTLTLTFLGYDDFESAIDQATLGVQFTVDRAMLEMLLNDSRQQFPNSWLFFSIQAHLGELHLKDGNYAVAEPLLIAGFEGMNERLSTIPNKYKNRIVTTLKKLVAMYESWHQSKPDSGHDAKAEAWKLRLDEWNDSNHLSSRSNTGPKQAETQSEVDNDR